MNKQDYINKIFETSDYESSIYFYKIIDDGLLAFTINEMNNTIYTRDLWPNHMDLQHLIPRKLNEHDFISKMFEGDFKIDGEMKI